MAPSTCLGRVRALRERGVIRGYHADIDPAALGRPIQAMIAVRLQAHARGHIPEFMAKIATLPEVLNVFFLGGANDFLVHIAATSTHNLRDFVVVNLSRQPRRRAHRDEPDLRARPRRPTLSHGPTRVPARVSHTSR